MNKFFLIVFFFFMCSLNAQSVKKKFNDNIFLHFDGDTSNPISLKKRIYICVSFYSCGLCFLQLETFLKKLDTAKFELALIVQSTNLNKYLIKEKYLLTKNIRHNYHILIESDFKSKNANFFKANGNPFIILATENNHKIKVIYYNNIFNKNGLIFAKTKKIITEFLN